MKFNYTIKRTNLRDCTLLSGASAFVFSEDENGKPFDDLLSEITTAENLQSEVVDLLLRKYIVNIKITSQATEEDISSIKRGLDILDNQSLLIRSKMETHKDPAIVTLQRIVVCGFISNLESACESDLLQLFNYITFDMSGYELEELRENVFNLGKALQQTANNVWTYSPEVLNNLDDENQLDRMILSRMENFAVYSSSEEKLENPFVRVLI